MTRSFLAIGECMVELSERGDGLYRRGFAGDTFNTAWYARRLLPADWAVAYGSAIGQDAISDEMARFMEGEGISTDALVRASDRTVGLYMIALKDGERSFSYWRGQSAARTLGDDPDRLRAMLAGRDMIHFSGITLAILPPEARGRLCDALAEARKAGATIAFDTNLRPALWDSETAMREGLTAGAAVADIVLPSFDEEEALFGDGSPEETVARYREGGALVVAVKNGGAPLTLWTDAEGLTTCPPVKVADVVDTTAAGDSFAAAFLARLAVGAAPSEAADAGMTLAARVIGAPGALVPGLFGDS